MSDCIRKTLESVSEAARAAIAAHGPALVENKRSDGFDPVTTLDRAIEERLREIILDSHPGDGIFGEELGWTNQGARRHWSIDPVDGTRALVCDLPSWAVLVGVIEDGKHMAGMIDCPPLDLCLVADCGSTSRNGEAVTSSNCSVIGEARLSTTDPNLFEGAEAEAFARVREAALLTRYGLDALAYARVATGGIDLVIESGLRRYDLDALVAVVRGAGGHIGDWSGGEDWDGGRIVAAATRVLYDEAVALLAA